MVDFAIFDEGLERILEIYSGATNEDVDNLNTWINELGLTCTDYLDWYTTGAGWENQEAMEVHMSECAAQIAGILGCGVYTNDYLKWWVDGWDDLPIVWCEISGESGTCYWTTARLAKATDTPQLWDWNSSNGIASAEQTSAAYKAITGNGLDKDFHHNVWNDMVDKVQEILNYLNRSWTESDNNGNTYLSYENTIMSEDDSNDRFLTADRFNALRFNIDYGYSEGTGIKPVNAGDKVYGWYFTQLAERINEWINVLQ